MPILRLLVKPDNTFLTQAIYEGLMALIYYNRDRAETSIEHIIFPHDALRRLFETINSDRGEYERITSVKMIFAGNDKVHKIPNKILSILGISVGDENIKTYGDLARILVENFPRIPDLKDSVLTYRLKGGVLVVGERPSKIAAPQLFKIDRYTGYTSMDKDTTYKQFSLKPSPLWILIGIIGVLSSYISSFGNTHYFVFLSPDEIIEVLGRNDTEYIYNVYFIKQRIINKLRDLLKTYIPEEVVILSTILDLNLMNEMRQKEIDYMTFQIYRIQVEGNTYKIYNTIPLTVYSKPYYLDVLEEISKNPDKMIEILSEVLTGKSVIIQTLRSLNYENVYTEASHVLLAIQSLYRLISLGDPNGFYGFIRGIETACKILESGGDPGAKTRLRQYMKILNTISKNI